MNDDRRLSAAEREQLAQELLELHFGCHENPEHLEARLENEPAVRELQQEVLRQARVLESAVRPEQAPLPLRAPDRAARPSRWRLLRSPLGRVASFATVAAAVVLGFFVAERTAASHAQREASERLHLTVSAPRAVPAATPWSVTVQTKDLTGAAVDCKVKWETLLADGSVLAASEVGTQGGAATIAMVADQRLRVPDRVVITATTATDSVKQVLPLSIADACPLVHVSTDRPVYRPGEPVFVRAVVLDRVTHLPIVQAANAWIRAELVDAKGASITQDQGQLAIGAFVLAVPADSAGGPHRVRVSSTTGAFAPEIAEIVVRTFQAPQLQKQVVLDRASYAPGTRGSAEVTALRLAAGGGGASGATARGALVIDGKEVWNEKKALGPLGEATFAFAIPKEVEKGAARFVATIDDGGIVETEVRPFVVPIGKVLVGAYPEGGELVAGVENTLYLELTDALGRPIDEGGALLDDRGRTVATFATQHQGRSKLAFVPKKGGEYRVRIVGQTEPVALPAVKESGIAMRLVGDDVGAAEPLRLALAGRGDGPWLVGVFCRGVLVGQTTLRADDRGELHERAEIALPATAAGVLRVTVFDRNLQAVAERLVRRLPAHKLDVAVSAQGAKLNPGDAQQITVRTSDETGAPQPAVVGVSVSDLAALSLGSEPPVGLVDDALLFADVERMENLGDFFLGANANAQHVDLLLGTRGWRRFVWRNDAAAQAAVAAHGDVGRNIARREGFGQAPQVVSNLDAARAAIWPASSSANRARHLLEGAATLVALLLAALSIAELFAWLTRGTLRASPWAQLVASVGAVGLFVGLFAAPMLRAARDEAPEVVLSYALDFRASASGGAIADQASGYRPMGTNAWQVQLPFDLGSGGWDDRLLSWTTSRGFAGGDPAANPLAGAFYNDGGDADIRARTENFFRGTNLSFDEFDRTTLQLGLLGYRQESRGDDFWYSRLARTATREYSHRHQPSDERRDFTPTIYWNALVATDASGSAAITFTTTDAVTTWRVRAEAHTTSGVGRLGQGTLDFATQQPLHVEAKLPDEVSAGDRLLLPINAIVTDTTLPEVAFTAKLGGGLRLDASAPTTIALREGRGRALLPITVAATPGVGTLELAARAGSFTDRVLLRLAIAPRGFPHRRSYGGSVEAGKPSSTTIAIPNESVAGTGRVTLKVFPSPISALTEGLDGILQEPHGCFEQASSSNYPNTLVLELLDASGDNVPVVAAKAHALLPRGYAKITGYECKQKGYEWFGADPGHEALTAYGLLQFHDMAKVYDVDAAMVDRTRQWLLARRDGKGNFVHQGQDHHSFGGRSQVLTNAYVVYALLQSGTPANELKAELDALAARSTTKDPYELALIVCAFHLAQRPETNALRQQLAALQQANGALHGTTTSITCSGGRDLEVETTGFAILAWLPDAAFAANVRSAIEFVQSCRTATGTFGATQATIVALRAVTAYATATRAMRTDGTLRIFDGDRQLAERAFAANETKALVFELWDKLPAGEHTLRLEVDGGGGPLPWACDVSYNAEQPADDPSGAIAIATQLRSPRAAEGDTVALDVTVTNTTGEARPTPIAIVGLPANCELPTRVLEDLQKSGAFAAWELRGRELVLYWRDLAPRAEQRLTLDLVARLPGVSDGPASRSYCYYTPAGKRWAAPARLEVTPR